MNFKELTLARKAIIIALSLIFWIIATLWVGSFLFLIKLGEPRSLASPTFLFQYFTVYGHFESVRFWMGACLGLAALLMILPLIVFLLPKNRKLFGDAKLGTFADFKKANMLGGKGCFFFMTLGKNYIYSPLNKVVSACLIAPPRSGKGTSQIQPNMLSIDASAIVTDIRQECFELTSHWRAQFSETYLINPFPSVLKDKEGKTVKNTQGKEVYELHTHKYNPFFYVPEEYSLRVNELQKIASYLFPDPPNGTDSFWASAARSLFLGISLYIFETEGLPKTIGEVLRQIQNCGTDGDNIGKYWQKIMQKRERSNPLSAVCKNALNDFIGSGGNTLTSIRKTVTSGLSLWENPSVDATTSGNDFDLTNLRKKRMTIYLAVTPDNLARAQPLLNLFLQQALDLNMREMPNQNPDIKHKLALFLDEIPALGKMPILAKTIGYLNGYWIMPYFIFQSFSQLRSVYGKEDAETIIDCCQIKIAFPPKSQEDAELLSKELGTYTEKSKNISTGRGLLNDNQGSTSTSAASRALFLPQELKNLDPDSVILLAEGVKPVIGKKLHYWKTQHLMERVKKPIEIPKIEYALPSSATSINASAFQDAEDTPVICIDENISADSYSIATSVDDIFAEMAKAESFQNQEENFENGSISSLASASLDDIEIAFSAKEKASTEKENVSSQPFDFESLTAYDVSSFELKNEEVSQEDIEKMLSSVIQTDTEK